MNRAFLDLDGVIVDFHAYMRAHGLTGDEIKRQVGAYLDMPAIPGALAAVRSLIGMGFEVWIATKPPTGVPHAYSDKAAWILRELPELKRRIIVTHDKGLLGDSGDYLCDDRPHKANCEQFKGTLIRFVDGYHWPQALDYFRARSPVLAKQRAKLATDQGLAVSVPASKPEAAERPSPDRSAPERIWLQVDSNRRTEDLDERFPANASHVTWCAHPVGGLEIEYVRADLAAHTAFSDPPGDPATAPVETSHCT